jgi:hypothetical protein
VDDGGEEGLASFEVPGGEDYRTEVEFEYKVGPGRPEERKGERFSVGMCVRACGCVCVLESERGGGREGGRERERERETEREREY